MDKLNRTLAGFEPMVLSLFRIMTGLLLFQYGVAKILKFPVLPYFAKLPPLITAAGTIELVGGALLILGLFTRPVAFILSGQMAFAYFIGHMFKGEAPVFIPLLNGGNAAILFCFACLYLACTAAARAFQDEIDLARQHPAFPHQGLGAHERLERAQVGIGLARQVHRSEHRDVEAEPARIQQTAITLDIASLLERPDPAQAGRRRNTDAFGQLHIGNSAVGLDFGEDFEVDFVEFLDTRVRVLAEAACGMGIGNTLSAACTTCAILLRVRCAIFPPARGKFADMDCDSCIACQMSYLGFDTFSAAAMPIGAHSAQTLAKFP